MDPQAGNSKQPNDATRPAAGPAGTTIKPLITAAEMFPALERLVLGAEREVLLSFRVFDACTRVHSDEAKEAGLGNWADLLTHVAERGVKVRLLLADFDPIFTSDLHRAAWASARVFGARLPDSAELLCALHECRSAPVWKYVFSGQVKSRLEEIRNIPGESMTPIQQRALRGEWDLRPVTLHQKLGVVDNARAIIGGLDVDERRWDDAAHDKRPEQTWHDVSLQVEGPVCSDIRAHFADCWDRSMAEDAVCFSSEATPVEDVAPPRAILPGEPRVVRTMSCHKPGYIRLGATTMVREHEEVHLRAFAEAQDYVFIETQFFRHAPLARALARAAERAPNLQLILLMPTEPERVIFDGNEGFDSRHAQALQIRCLDICKRVFGDRMVVVSPVQPREARDGSPMPVRGAGIVYVHSKVTLVDDSTAIVGSANLNGRSMRWDTEASLMFHSKDDIRNLHDRLARIWLGDHYGGDIRLAKTWNDAARANAAREPDDRSGFVMPYPERRNRRFARFMPILPPEMF